MDICGHDDFFFALHLILDGTLDICGHDDLFFTLHLVLDENLDICGHDDLLLLFTRFWAEIWTSADMMTFFALHLMRNCIYVCLTTCNIDWKWVIWLCQIAKRVAE